MSCPSIHPPPRWAFDDAELLKSFLDTPTGKLFLTHLAWLRPSIPPAHDKVTNPVASAYELRGYEGALFNLLSLREATPNTDAPITANYPDPEDDSLWPTSPTN